MRIYQVMENKVLREYFEREFFRAGERLGLSELEVDSVAEQHEGLPEGFDLYFCHLTDINREIIGKLKRKTDKPYVWIVSGNKLTPSKDVLPYNKFNFTVGLMMRDEDIIKEVLEEVMRRQT